MVVSKKLLLLGTVCISLLFASCKKDDGGDTKEGLPGQIIDEDHVQVNDIYGITVICPKNAWTNSYRDTMPETSRDYYKDYLYNAVVLGSYADSLTGSQGTLYPTQLALARFISKPANDAEADAFKAGYKKTCFDELVGTGAYYEQVSELSDTTLNGYKASYFYAIKGYNQSPGMTEVYLMYYNGRMYGALINIVYGKSDEDAYDKCVDVLNTIKLK